ncbi:spore germination protein [Paenibacillus sp. N4]|uniref:GerAB/ArcD/ProY family transporter n=1 Tax=Paenibacillus vietnamensis TaxID=2590547 RepID=UPI001CD0CDD2|nr:GerAB/ArcD/ProY family transporter [Paenibacillus vietnamensis]MCA0758491.1 spore germination protein [Paenibacillus vietnamensis]
MSKSSSVSPTQLFAMIILFEFGTALVLPIGQAAGSNVWLSILLAMPGGMILYVLYTYFNRQFPALTLSGYIRKILGPYFGWPVSFLYIVYFIYISSRNLREAGDLLISASYDETPLATVHAVMIIAVIYVIYKGVNVLFRLGEIYILIIISLGILSQAAVLFSGALELRNLLPLMGEGFIPTLRDAYPNILMFPFSELICFATIFPHMKQQKLIRKTGLLAILASSLMLSLSHAIEIAIIGKDIYSRATFPLFTSITIVEVAEFMQRLDPFVILTLIIGVFFKMTVYAYAVTAMAADLFRIEDRRQLAFPIGIVIFLISVLSAWSFPEHNSEGRVHLITGSPFFTVAVPILLLLVHLLKKRSTHS